MDRAWILLGMMGAGKSAVGRAIAESSGRDFRDTDALLQARLGRPISQIFSIYGEHMFRDHETSLLKDMEPGPFVLSTGGGIVVRPENMDHLKRLGTTMYLSTPIDVLVKRLEVSKKKRPLLDTDNWQERVQLLLEQRLPMYTSADIILEDDGLDIAATAERAIKAFQEFRTA